MAQLILTVDDLHVPRVQAAFGEILGSEGGMATAEEVRQHLIEYVRDTTLRYERSQSQPDALTVT